MLDENRTQKATLGCGSLILIALIVMFFSHGAGTSNLEQQVQSLRAEVVELRKAVEAETKVIKLLEDQLDKTKSKQ